MSNLDGAEEIAAQTSIRVNEHSRHGKFGWNVSPSIERASASREEKKVPAAPTPYAAPPLAMRVRRAAPRSAG
jgi:hypothetical protein